MSDSPLEIGDVPLTERRILFVGRLAGMSRREAERLVRERGARVVERSVEAVDVIVVSDELVDLRRVLSDRELLDEEKRAAIARGDIELIHESDLWARLGLLERAHEAERLYTPAMLAELVHVPLAAIRQWQRRGALRPKREVRRLAYFDFEEVSIARKLAALLAAGCSLANVNRKLDGLHRVLPASPRPLAEPDVVVEGRQLVIRRGDGLSEPSGQLLIDFDAAKPRSAEENGPTAIPLAAAESLGRPSAQARGGEAIAAEELRSLAAELEENGRLDQAIDVYRAILISGSFTADDHFALAELLYARGDLSAARERYYVAIEVDEDFVEARSNLGCVLAEQGELPLAEAAFRGALEYHPEYADAHYHLARLLDRANRSAEASRHWRLFMNLAPASPWADEARERLVAEGSRLSAVGCGPDVNEAQPRIADT